jgi:biotin transport system ATP-binding protein
MIELEGVSHQFGEHPVLRDIALTIAERRVAVVGANGSGKSTLARLLNGLVVPSHGRVRVDGLDTATRAKAVRRKVGFVFQDPEVQIVCPTVAEDIAFGLKVRGLDKPAIARRVDAVLDRYGLAGHRHHPAHLLSGGQKQLLAIAAVLVLEPDYVVFDEPTTLLDLRNRRAIAGIIGALTQPVVVVSHDLDLIAGFDRVIVLHEGRVAADDTPSAAIAAYVERLA